MTVVAIPSIDEIWSWLDDVPDPEIPVISVVDLGIVRDVAWEGETVVVTVTPTYTGCPATAVIAMEIETALRKKGLENIRLETQIAPPWTTAWLTQRGREKLKAYGIAPPADEASCAGAIRLSSDKSFTVVCPHCGSHDTEQVSRFGSTPCKASYRCKSCLEPFDYFKSI